MKIKVGIAVAAVVVLVVLLARFLGDGRNDGRGDGRTAPDKPVAAAPAPEPGSEPEAKPGTASAPTLARPPFGLADVVGMTVAHAALPSPLAFEKTAEGWQAKGSDIPADDGKIENILWILLEADRRPDADAVSGDDGQGGDGGARIVLDDGRGNEYALTVGLRPDGEYAAAHVRDDSGGAALVHGDLRGALGLWRNQPDAAPGLDPLLDWNVLRFDPEEAVKITALYPDHVIAFVRGEDGAWRSERQSPIGEWSRDGLGEWLADLAAFRVSGLADARETDAARPVPTHSIAILLATGEEKTLQVVPNHAGEGCIAWVSDYPALAFQLPEWRFAKYFNRIASLFPDAAPHFDPNDIRAVDVRRDGENVKIARRDDFWQAVALPYPPRPERMDRLARLLAAWRPVDYADPGGKNTASAYGGPMIEVVLANGEVHQYRLSGRHPLFPWRYVVVDGGTVLSITDAEVSAMFPGFADLLYLGPIFRPADGAALSRVRLEDAGGRMLATLTRSPDGVWTAATEAGSLALGRDEGDGVAEDPALWQIAGFSSMGMMRGGPMYRLEVGWGEESSSITLLQPMGRHIPYFTPDGRAFLLDRADFFNWLSAIRDIANRVEDEAARDASAREARERAAEAEAKDVPEAGEAGAGASGEEPSTLSPAVEPEGTPEAGEPGSDAPGGESPASSPAVEPEETSEAGAGGVDVQAGEEETAPPPDDAENAPAETPADPVPDIREDPASEDAPSAAPAAPASEEDAGESDLSAPAPTPTPAPAPEPEDGAEAAPGINEAEAAIAPSDDEQPGGDPAGQAATSEPVSAAAAPDVSEKVTAPAPGVAVDVIPPQGDAPAPGLTGPRRIDPETVGYRGRVDGLTATGE